MKIYLCGPINRCTDDEAMAWREWFKGGRVISSPEGMLFREPRLAGAEYVDPMDRDCRDREHEDYREIVWNQNTFTP
jgi:hypothetical protein